MKSLDDLLKSNRPLIAGHRGTYGGNIVENTVAAAKCAVASGADIVEFDVCRTLDNKVVVFHSGMEKQLYFLPAPMQLMPLALVKKTPFLNVHLGNSGQYAETLEEYLTALKGKCILNFDRMWYANADKCLATIAKLDMFDQIIFKANAIRSHKKLAKKLAKYKQAVFMGICTKPQNIATFEAWHKEFGLNLRGLEVIFNSEDSYFCSDEFFAYAKQHGYFTWVNAIVLNKRTDMCAGHGDNASLLTGPDNGWGWLVKKGYDVIQTDWCANLSAYLKS